MLTRFILSDGSHILLCPRHAGERRQKGVFMVALDAARENPANVCGDCSPMRWVDEETQPMTLDDWLKMAQRLNHERRR